MKHHTHIESQNETAAAWSRSYSDLGGLLLVAVIAYRLASEAAAMTFSEWLKVLIAPGVLAIVAYLFNRSLKMRELKIADKRAKDEALIEDQRAKDEALQSYLNHIATLLIEKELRHKKPTDEESICARANTLLTLRRLDSERKRNLLLFLCESGLIRKLSPEIREDATPVLDLSGADLKETDLSRCELPDAVLAYTNLRSANLSGANLQRTILQGADLSPTEDGGHTDLSGADLSGADLTEANLSGANLSGANLSRTNLTNLSRTNLSEAAGINNKELEQIAHCLEGATMPDGSKHP